MRMLSIDPSYSKPIARAIIDIMAEKPLAIGLIEQECEIISLKEIITAHKIEIAAIEDQYVGKNRRTDLNLAQKTGEIIAILKILKVPKIIKVKPHEWIKAFMRWRKGWPPKAIYLPAVHRITMQQFPDLNWSDYTKQAQEDISCAIQLGLYQLRKMKAGALLR